MITESARLAPAQLWQSSMFLAGAFSGLAAGAVSNRYGRRLTMSIGGLCFIAGSILQAVAPEVATLVVGRILLGVGIGAANQAWLLSTAEGG